MYVILPIDFHSIIFQDGHIAPPTRSHIPSFTTYLHIYIDIPIDIPIAIHTYSHYPLVI